VDDFGLATFVRFMYWLFGILIGIILLLCVLIIFGVL
jgi:hypothetical protein